MESRTPTTEKLAQALELAGAPQEMIAAARRGRYDDYKSTLPAPISALVYEARALAVRFPALNEIAQRAMDGEFDAQKWEADEWARSEEGQQTFRELLGGD